MGKPRMLGMFRTPVRNDRADMRRSKAWKRSREYTDKHLAVPERNRCRKK